MINRLILTWNARKYDFMQIKGTIDPIRSSESDHSNQGALNTIDKRLLRVPDLNNVCIDRCEAATIECIQECSSLDDMTCISQCIRDEQLCSNGKFIDNDSLIMTHHPFYLI